MRYLLALVCPPLGLRACGRPRQALANLILCLVGVATIRWGLGIIAIAGAAMWAIHTVADERASIETDQFIRTVRPIRGYRGPL